MVANLQARRNDLGDWAAGLQAHPPVTVEDENFYGSSKWKKKVRDSLKHHFPDNIRRTPIFVPGVIGSSDRLVKSTKIVLRWLATARNLVAVDMESSGLYRATRERCPMLAVRGISDIVGFERNEAWTVYACNSAAAFARALLRTRPIPLDVPLTVDPR